MYIKINNIQYPCVCYIGNTMVYHGLPDDFPAPVDEEITMCADDGFVLRVDNPADYLRQEFTNGVLILTNAPAPDPDPVHNPEPTEQEILDILLGVKSYE